MDHESLPITDDPQHCPEPGAQIVHRGQNVTGTTSLQSAVSGEFQINDVREGDTSLMSLEFHFGGLHHDIYVLHTAASLEVSPEEVLGSASLRRPRQFCFFCPSLILCMRMPELTPLDGSTPYSGEFFDAIQNGSLQSARVVVPLVLGLTPLRSVIDVGCGRGAWLRAFRDGGVEDIRGVDGDYVDTASLLIPRECFSAVDLNKPFELPGRYDLAVCLEVVEHLPAAMANVLVRQLTAVAPLVLFSAAIPGQGGTNHVNERPPAYWRGLFEAHGFMMFDPIRPAILADARIEWWYRQNIVVYAAKETVDRLALLETHRVPPNAPGIEWVHADIWAQAVAKTGSVRQLCRQLPAAIRKAIRRRLVGSEE
jgi:SAM-dependent methyltransferase